MLMEKNSRKFSHLLKKDSRQSFDRFGPAPLFSFFKL